MTEPGKGVSRTTLLYMLLAFFSIPHLIDDFLFGIPDEFGISKQLAQFLGGVFMVIFLAILIALDRGSRTGVLAAMAMGIFLSLAGILKHVPLILQPGPYWSGWFSEGLIFAMIITGLGIFLSGLLDLCPRG